MEGDLNVIEADLLKQHQPLLNIDGNPGSMNELKKLRDECKKIAGE